jgi:hypothetical protein
MSPLVPVTSARLPSSLKSSAPSVVATTTHAKRVMSPSEMPKNHQEVIRRALFHGVGAALVAVFSYETAR